MSEENPLHRAHALSAQASLLVRPTDTPPQVLRQALGAYREAADLFEASATAAGRSPDDAAQRTLQLLTTQHRKLVRDLERRIASTPANAANNNVVGLGNPSMLGTAAAAARPDVASIRRASEPVVPGSAGSAGVAGNGNEPVQARRTESTMLSLGGVGRGWINGATGIASRLTPSGTIPIPPFALRPPSFSPSDPTVPPPLPLSNPNPYASPSSNPNPNSTPSKPAGSAHLPSAPPSVSLSPLASSSSSSDPAESYVNFGAVPDTLDPFSRFWGMLENMLDDISNPVAFASAPVSIPLSSVDEVLQRARGKTRKKEKDRDREKDKDKEKDKSSKRDEGRDREPSPSESYYVINKSKIPEELQETQTQTKRNTSPVGKTAEELLMENESLKSSLDALATHAEALVKQNKELRQQAEEREKMMRSVVVGVRREARKAKQGQDLIRSQLVASTSPFKPLDGGHPAVATTPTPIPTQLDDPGIVTGLKKRIRELEKEVESLKVDNEKQRAHVQKYRDRFDKIKTTSRAKRAEKEASATASIGSSGVDVGKPTPPRPLKSPEH
ncbi:hypothetical protein EHS25_001139 [Saitozyma podzolica]|uniref:Uncharacterized protein n=1 Tax=Saitozyma podzolica TaxID=1890683 RepID=A0A427YHR3_9TREE|nr:hypothetical protein EHS25_001139 [Saitozyma podzolica]